MFRVMQTIGNSLQSKMVQIRGVPPADYVQL